MQCLNITYQLMQIPSTNYACSTWQQILNVCMHTHLSAHQELKLHTRMKADHLRSAIPFFTVHMFGELYNSNSAASRVLWKTASMSLSKPALSQQPYTESSLFWYTAPSRGQQNICVNTKKSTLYFGGTLPKIIRRGWVCHLYKN